jgi:hypothetical protein
MRKVLCLFLEILRQKGSAHDRLSRCSLDMVQTAPQWADEILSGPVPPLHLRR